MSANSAKIWLAATIVVLGGSIATALVPQSVPILPAIAKEFNVNYGSLGWIVSFPTLVCAFGALAFGMVVDRVGDVRLLLAGLALVILGDAGVSLAPELDWLFAARLFQGLGYVSITVAGPTLIQRITTGEVRRAAMALWAAHTPIGFAAAIFFGSQLIANHLSWRWSFLGHAAAASIVGIAVLAVRYTPSVAKVSRSSGTGQVLTSSRTYAVGVGALSAAMIQVGVMTLLPSFLINKYGLTAPQSALVIVAAMAANWLGSMVVVATNVRKIPMIALPITAVSSAFFGMATISAPADPTLAFAFALLFSATIGTANSFIWSFIPAAIPSPEAVGATAGLVTQGSYIGALLGPPIFFWIWRESVGLNATLGMILAVLMLIPLFTQIRSERSGIGKSVGAADAH